MGHWTHKLYQLFENEYKKQSEQSSQESYRGGATAVLNGLKATIKRNYHSWTETRRERKRGELGERGLEYFAEYIQEHQAEALKKRQEERMKKRESKLNQIKSDLECHKERPVSSRRHLHMRNAKSVRYKPDNQPGQNGTNSRKLVLPEPLEIFVDGPFGSPSSNIYRAEHAVLIGTGIGESLSLVRLSDTT